MKLRIIFTLAAMSLPHMAGAAELTGEAWRTLFARALPSILCEEKFYFRQCFRVEAVQCEKAALSATRVCLDDLKAKIPAVFTTKQQSEEIGALVGQCVGTTFEIKFSAVKSADSKCRNADAWMK